MDIISCWTTNRNDTIYSTIQTCSFYITHCCGGMLDKDSLDGGDYLSASLQPVLGRFPSQWHVASPVVKCIIFQCLSVCLQPCMENLYIVYTKSLDVFRWCSRSYAGEPSRAVIAMRTLPTTHQDTCRELCIHCCLYIHHLYSLSSPWVDSLSCTMYYMHHSFILRIASLFITYSTTRWYFFHHFF